MKECKHLRTDIPCENCEIEKLKKENEWLREALAIYAYEINWVFDPFTSQRIFVSASDPWMTAQKALEEMK